MAVLSKEQKERYRRQISVVGEDGQERECDEGPCKGVCHLS
jgi:hypothetical protein